MKKSIIAVMLSVVITPAAYADSFSYSVDSSGQASALTNTTASGVTSVTAAPGKITFIGSDNQVINLDHIQGNLDLINDHQNQITDNRIAIDTNANDIATNKASIDNNALAIHNTDNHLQSVDAQTQQLKINNIQDRQELAAHDQAIKTNQRDITNTVAAIQQTNADVTKNAGAIAKNTAGVATNRSAIANLSTQNRATYSLASDASQLSIKEEQQIVTLTRDTKVAQATGEYAQSRAQTAMQNAEKNRVALAVSNKKIAANSVALADHEQRIETLEQSNSSNFGKLKNEVEENRKRASAGIAGVAAMANIPQVTNTQNFSVGAGVGNTDGENALAVGFSARATENVVVKASVSNDTQHNFVVGGGIAYGW